MYKNAIFDLDGTLFDTGNGIATCVKYTLEQMNLAPISKKTMLTFVGPSLFESFNQTVGLSEQDSLKAVAIYREKYKEVGIYDCKPFDGVEEMLSLLKVAGVMLSVASSKPLESVKRVLTRFKLISFFDKICAPDFGERSSDKSANIGAAKICDPAVMIGDRKFDILGAKANGLDSVGVTFGYAPEGEFIEFAPTYLAANCAEIVKIILG